jgi:beta-glucosidase
MARFKLIYTLLVILVIAACDTGQENTAQRIRRELNQLIDRRVDDLLSSMTLEEKVGQINWPCVYKDEYGVDIPAKQEGVRKYVVGDLIGIGPGGGFFTLANEISREGTRQQAEVFNELQQLAIEKTRLKIPLMQVEEGTHGFMAPGATIFPEGLGLGATWNTDLIENVYSAAAKEARAVGVHQLFTLVIEPNRDPRHGRNQQTYSEDPFLCSRLAEAIVHGAQGEDISANDKVIAGLCHYPGQTQGLNGINRGSMDISERTIREIYLPPWEAGVKKAGALGVMATHPSIDGYPNHGSIKYLTTILRDELGFKGNVLSEGSNTGTLIYERVVATEKEAGPIVLNAGVDVNITFESGYMGDMIENVKEGNVSMDLLDRAVRRVLRLKFRLGLFEDPFVDVERAIEVVHNKEHLDLALESAREGIVLLKNENDLLPLDKNIRSIAVIGPNADDRENLLGDYIPKKLLYEAVTVREAIKSKVSPGTKVSYVKGCNVLDSTLNEIPAARAAASQADVAIVVVGEDERTDGESDDAADLDLTGYQADLIKAVHGTGTPTIVVLISGRPLTIRWTAEHVPAIMEAWMCGERGGEAIADVLFGDVNPSGKLPITFPRHVGQMPFYYNYKPAKFNRHWRAYVTYPLTPLWEFGYGLSYTQFEYTNLRISPGIIGPDDHVDINLDVKNVGDLAGKEVVQLYIDDVISSVVTPIIELKGFEKISLEPGEQKTVSFQLSPHDISLLNMAMEREVEPGTFDVMIGKSCKDIRLKGSFEVAE